MRASVWCALALTLLAVTSALRPTQGEGSARISRRPPLTASTEESPAQTIDDVSTPRTRGSRRREETTPRHVVRSRTRTRPPEVEGTTESEARSGNGNNERFDSRRSYSRTRNRTNSDLDSPKADVIRSRSRYTRPAPTPPPEPTLAPETSPPMIDESKIEVIASTLDDIPKMVFREDTTEPTAPRATTEFRRRSSKAQVTETPAPAPVSRRRGRVTARTNAGTDLASSGTTNSISISEKGPTTDKMIDLRNSRKLRYKQRLSETDTNLTLGSTSSNQVIQSSQNESSPSQETLPSAPAIVEKVQQSTETNPLKTTTLKVMRIVRRPIQRKKGTFKPSPSDSLPKKRSDEVSEDDNYPEPFKALLQAKNASTQASSPTAESLSVKASQKVYKTYTPTQQSTFTSPGRNKYSRLRTKSNAEEESKKEENPVESTAAPRVSSTRLPEHKYRSSYSTRNRKFSTQSTSTTAANTNTITNDQSTEKPVYKFNRKLKLSTTESPASEPKVNTKRMETNNLLKRTLNRSPYYSRRNSSNSDVVTPDPSNENKLNIGSALDSIAKHKASLPRTSYYSRQRNSNKIAASSTEEPFRETNSVADTADRKNEDNADMPLIFTLLKPSDAPQSDAVQNETQTEKTHKMFVIAVTSKESQETSTEHEMTSNTVEENETKPIIEVSSTPKYHATYTVPQSTVFGEEREIESPVSAPPIKNIHTRKFGRAKANARSQNREVSNDSPARERGSGKYTDGFSKTTEASTNGISPDTEKSKHRFSSKYRAAYLEKPFYRPTVPTVTPSTIEGEEFQLGPDMNAISFTQTRRPAELLKLSESLVKPSHVMNVEASQHSQSVTVSIFDALADILTSTPRNRLSSTTEVNQKQTINTDLIQALNGVSNNINVNSGVLPSQDTLSLNVNVNTNTNVQNTDLTPNVNNPLVAAGVTPALTTPQASPTPTSTTPVSARRPFAFKVLYSDPTDKLLTAPEPTSNQPTTDNPTMVYNTVSDLLLSNNNVVSSELTSMLSSNINNILRNMDDRAKSRISKDMAKILKSLIPRAIEGLDDNADSIPNTTPYSLDEIKDTENVNFDVNLNVISSPVSLNLVQNADLASNVNITLGAVNTTDAQSDSSKPANVAGLSQITVESQTTLANLDKPTTTLTTEATISQSTNAKSATSVVTTNSDSIIVDSDINDKSTSSNPNVPLPFFTNFQINDFIGTDVDNANSNTSDMQNLPIPFSTRTVTESQNDNDSNIQEINDVTPLQLWILSKKAKVLKMIEDLLREHNNELANATALTEMFGQTNNSPISARLTEIMNTMNTTTDTTDTTNDSILSTTPSLPTPLSAQSSNNSSDSLNTSGTSSEASATSTESLPTVSSRLNEISTSTFSTSSNAETATALLSTTEAAVDLSNRSLNEATTPTTSEVTSTQSIEAITPSDIATTTQADQEPTTENIMETTTEISSSALNLKDSSSGVTAAANKPPVEQSTASHVLRLRTSTMLPSIDEILLNSLSSAAKEEMVISSMTSSTRQPTILTLDIDPETKQIRTEKPGEGNDNAVFKFISIDEVTVRSQNSNVLKLASSKSPTTTETSQTQGVTETITESNTQTPQIPLIQAEDDPTTTAQGSTGTTVDASTESVTITSVLTTTSTEASTTPVIVTETPTTMVTTTAAPITTTTAAPTTTTTTAAPITTTTAAPVTTTTEATTTTTTQAAVTTTEAVTTTVTTTTVAPTTKAETETIPISTVTAVPTVDVAKEEAKRYEDDTALLKAFLDGTERIPKTLNFNNLDQSTGTTSMNTKTTPAMTTQQSEEDKFLQALLSAAGNNPHTLTKPSIGGRNGVPTTTARSIEDDIRQFEEDTKLLKALLQATGQNPANFNIPSLDITTTTVPFTTETATTPKPQTTTQSTDAKQLQLQENARILQMLLQATGQNTANLPIPVISGITSNVRIASNPYTTSLASSPTTPINIRPVYSTRNTSPVPRTTTMPPSTVTVPTTLQPRGTDSTTVRISTTFLPRRRQPTTAVPTESTTIQTARRVPLSRFAVTTEMPTSSTFSVEEDLAFLNNLKSVLNTNTNGADPEAALANRIIALAVDRSLSEIKTGKPTERTGKNIVVTTTPPPTTTRTTTTTPRPTTTAPSTPSIEDDIRQFEEDTKLLQALLKATGQDPSKLNLPSLPNINANVSPKLPAGINNDLNLLSNLLAAPSPLNEPFDSLTQRPNPQLKATGTASAKPFGAKIAVQDDLKNAQDDEKLLQTLIQLQGAQETTTLRSKIAITGQSSDEALKQLIQQAKPTGMVPAATKMPLAISTEYGKSNDALLAALLKEQGFGPTTASSLDEQLRLAGAAQTVQNVIRAGQRAATDVYSNGSGASG